MFEIVNEINNNEFASTTQNPECFKDNYIVKHVIGSSVEEYLKYGLLDIENVQKKSTQFLIIASALIIMVENAY